MGMIFGSSILGSNSRHHHVADDPRLLHCLDRRWRTCAAVSTCSFELSPGLLQERLPYGYFRTFLLTPLEFQALEVLSQSQGRRGWIKSGRADS